MKKLFIITGEHSGDKHAAAVVREIKKNNPDIIIEAIGGENLKNEGVKLFSGHDKMQGVGITPKMIIEHFSIGKKVVNYLKNEFKPDLVLLIDYGVFNLNVAKFLKAENFKIFYFIPPQIWASRKHRIKNVKKYIDKVLTIFPFEKELYDEFNIKEEFVGHPILHEMPPKADRNEFCKKYDLDPNKKIVSIFPGSRPFEIQYLLKTFLKAGELIEKEVPGVQIVVCQSPTIKDNLLKTKYKVIKNENYTLLSVSDALILASGTVALEAALYQTPMIISYRGPLIFYLIYLSVRNIKKASLPNIMSGKDIVPEFLMYDSKPEPISKKIIELLNNEEVNKKMREDLGEIVSLMGGKNAGVEVARIICEEINNG